MLEASIIGGIAVLAATVAGDLVPGSPLEPYFSLSRDGTVLALAVYGFIAAVLPVWLLLCPRDYLSSFLKIGTILLLVAGVIVANPMLEAPSVSPYFATAAARISTGPFSPMSSSASCAGPSRAFTPWSPRARRPRWSTGRATSG